MNRIKSYLKSNRAVLGATLLVLVLAALGVLDPVLSGGLVFAMAGVSAIESQGTTIAVSTVGSPSSFANIGNITGFKGPGGSANVIDVTNLSSAAKEKLMGLPDEGQFTLDVNYDPDNTQHQALRNARANRTLIEIKITFTDTSGGSAATTAVFSGYVLGFEVSGAVDQQVKAAITIEISGAVAWN